MCLYRPLRWVRVLLRRPRWSSWLSLWLRMLCPPLLGLMSLVLLSQMWLRLLLLLLLLPMCHSPHLLWNSRSSCRRQSPWSRPPLRPRRSPPSPSSPCAS